MNAKEQLEKMVGSDFMTGLSEMTRQLETADMTNDITTEPEVLAIDVMYDLSLIHY